MCLKGKAGDFGEACLGGDHWRRPVCERRVREEGERADRWGHAVNERRRGRGRRARVRLTAGLCAVAGPRGVREWAAGKRKAGPLRWAGEG